ncbi:hypothetical protein MRB53_040606 [Persea americana]|nr:hypothetical protein MRB53_040606 [Persea americana]
MTSNYRTLQWTGLPSSQSSAAQPRANLPLAPLAWFWADLQFLNAASQSCDIQLHRTTMETCQRLQTCSRSMQAAALRPTLRHIRPCEVRHASHTYRRQRKLLNIPPAPAFGGPQAPTGSSSRSHTQIEARPSAEQASSLQPSSLHARIAQRSIPTVPKVIYDPPPSLPNVHHTPPLFLPPGDPRRQFSPPPRPFVQTGTSAPPPIIRPPGVKRYHVTPDQIEEMRALRQADDKTWTQSRLAERFQCSKVFVQTVVQAGPARTAWHRGIIKSRETEATRARATRKKIWERDE